MAKDSAELACDYLVHERIVIVAAWQVLSKIDGLVSTSSRLIENTEPVLSSSRLSPMVVSRRLSEKPGPALRYRRATQI